MHRGSDLKSNVYERLLVFIPLSLYSFNINIQKGTVLTAYSWYHVNNLDKLASSFTENFIKFPLMNRQHFSKVNIYTFNVSEHFKNYSSHHKMSIMQLS